MYGNSTKPYFNAIYLFDEQQFKVYLQLLGKMPKNKYAQTCFEFIVDT